MTRLLLVRAQSTEQGTPGMLMHEQGGRLALTLELPWKDNQRRRSCIPTGQYPVRLVQVPKHGLVYCVGHVPGRDSILIHTGNVAGDVEKGLESDVLGCILVGEKRGYRRGQVAIFDSRTAFRKFMAEMNGRPFTLEIRQFYEPAPVPEGEEYAVGDSRNP